MPDYDKGTWASGENDRGCRMNRRALLVSAPIAIAAAMAARGTNAAVAGMLTAGESDTPVMLAFREWSKAKANEDAVYAATPDNADGAPARDAITDARIEVENDLMATPSQTVNDWALKIAAWSNFGDGVCQDRQENSELWAEADALIRVN